MLYFVAEVAAVLMMAHQRAFEASHRLHQPFGGLFVVGCDSVAFLLMAAAIGGWRPWRE